MRTSHGVYAVLIGLILSVLATTNATAATRLVLHWDKQTGNSWALVEDSSGGSMADFPWDGALPLGYISEDDEVEIPTFIIIELRNQLEQSTAEEAPAALELIRDLLGPFADTPIEEISTKLTSRISYSEVSSAEWCGSSIDGEGACVEGVGSQPYNALCRGFACKGTTIQAP